MTEKVVIDTDMGVDDAVALAFLVEQQHRPIDLLGICTVWGNTSAEGAARSAAGLLAALGRPDVPVATGAAGPLSGRPSRVGALAHGRDGMWGVGPAAGDPGALAGSALDLYRSLTKRHSKLTVLAIGPLTNLARLAAEDPTTYRAIERVVVLGGAKHRGTMTPVSETNFWHDPEAADQVLAAGVPVTLITRDAHGAFALDDDDLRLATRGTSATARALGPSLAAYAEAARRFGEPVNLGDVVAAAVLLDSSRVIRAERAHVRVIGSIEPLVRGQSVIGVTPNQRLTMADGGSAALELIERAADDPALDVRGSIGAILARAPLNAEVVLEVDVPAVRRAFLEVFS